MIVCVCHRVSHKIIEQCARAGAHFDDIRAEHKLGAQCGQCEHAARRIWDSAYASHDCNKPAPQLRPPSLAARSSAPSAVAPT